MTNRTIDAYAAGLIDGEGCISIYARKNQHYGARVDVGMTVKARTLLDQMKAEYGGTVTSYRERTERWEATYAWRLTTPTEVVRFLNRIEPFLRLKAEQAFLALSLERVKDEYRLPDRGRVRWTDDLRTRCAVIKRRMHELNQKGPSTPPLANQSPIAWLVAGTWVTGQADLFSDLGWEPFSGTWPKSGMCSGGRAYELPTWAPAIGGNAGSDTQLLGTPRCADGMSHPLRDGVENPRGRLEDQVSLLPTPKATDGTKGGPNQRGSSGDLTLPSAAARLLPTPTAVEYGNNQSPSAGAAVRPSLSSLARTELLQTPRATDWKDSMTAPAAMRHVENGQGTLAETLGYHLLSSGDSSSPPSDAGNLFSAEPHPNPPSPAATATGS